MLKIILAFEFVLFAIVGMARLRGIGRYWRSLGYKEKMLALAWSAMIVGQYQMIPHESQAVELGSIDAGGTYQLAWMFAAGLLTLPLLLSTSIDSRVWKLPVVAWAMYIFFAFGSVVLSPLPAFTIYRALQLGVDLALLLVAYSILKKSGKSGLLVEVSIFWLMFLLFMIIAGATLKPEVAFAPSPGVFGISLRGVYPEIHQNELGLMAAIGLVIGIVRGMGGASKGLLRLFWITVALVAGTILFLAQARTSLGSSLIALIAVGFMVRRLRWMTYFMGGIGAFVVVYSMLSGSKLGIEDDIEAYARRGVTDQQLENLSGRTRLWSIGWEMFKDSPVLGHGFQAGVRDEGGEYGLSRGTNMHSGHMQVLVDTGALGYVTWLTFILGVSVTVYKNYRSCNEIDERTRMLAVEYLLVVFVIIFRSVLGQILVSHQTNLMIFLSIYVYCILRPIGRGSGQYASDSGLGAKRKRSVLRVRGALTVRGQGAGLRE